MFGCGHYHAHLTSFFVLFCWNFGNMSTYICPCLHFYFITILSFYLSNSLLWSFYDCLSCYVCSFYPLCSLYIVIIPFYNFYSFLIMYYSLLLVWLNIHVYFSCVFIHTCLFYPFMCVVHAFFFHVVKHTCSFYHLCLYPYMLIILLYG